MLHTETVATKTLELLTQLMDDSTFNQFLLVGGTVLKAISYFDDINYDEPIQMLDKKDFEWKKIRKHLLLMVKSPDKIFGDCCALVSQQKTNRVQSQSFCV